MKAIIIVIALGISNFLQAQIAYEAEEFVNDFDLGFAVKQMQKSKYIGSAIVCEAESPATCDSAANVSFETQKGHLSLPLQSFTEIQHYSIDSTQIMSAENPQINRLMITAKSGELVRSTEEGEVTSIFKIPGNELVVMIKHGSYRTVYGTLDNLKVQVGDWVKKDDIIGEVADIEKGKMVFEIWKTTNNINESLKVEQWIELRSSSEKY